jgi:transposase InsO family protein
MKMTSKEFESWCARLNLSRDACEEVNRIRSSEPARLTDSGPTNVSGIFNKSWKMGHSVQFESHSVELQAVLLYEDPQNDVIEYWDQPNKFTVHFKDKKEKSRGHKCTPDYFVIRNDSAGWEEWKTEEKLLKLTQEHPDRYYQDDDGTWHYPPGEEYARQYNFYFRIRSSAEINYTLARNTTITHRFYKPGYVSVVDSKTFTLVSDFLSRRPQTTLSSLLEFAEENSISSGCIYELIATKGIYFNVNKDLLTEPERTYVYLSQEDAAFYESISVTQSKADEPLIPSDIVPGSKAYFDGRPIKILLVGSTIVCLEFGGGETVDISISKFESYVVRGLITGLETRQHASISDAAREYAEQFGRSDRLIALERYQLIQPVLRGEKVANTPVSMRTIRAWVKRHKEAKEKYGNGLLGLIPLHKNKGSSEPKLPNQMREDMIQCIKDTYETVAEKNMSASYGEFIRRCKKKKIPTDQIPVLSTYRNEILARAGRKQEEKRKGTRAAYLHEEFYWWIDVKTPPHGERPWQICHIDHTPLPILLVNPKTFKVLGVPTLTLLMDAFTRRILAFYLSFDRESRKALMMVMRDCVRRHGRFPELVVVDKGSAFRSVYFDTLLARYNCDKKLRPTAKPRFGSPVERVLGTTQSQFIKNLMGNTKPWNDRRAMTKSVNPENLAVWSYGLLYPKLDEYFHDYNNREHPALDGQSPQEAYEFAMKQYDLPYDEIVYDRNFLTETLLETPRGKGKIVPGRGIKFQYVFYNSPKFQQAKLIGQTFETRFDPYNAGSIWAFINRRWEEGCAPPSLYNLLRKCSANDVELMSEELRQRRRRHAGGFALRAEDVARHLASAAEDEERELQRKLDLEAFAKRGVAAPMAHDASAKALPASTSDAKSKREVDGLAVYPKIQRNK